MLHGNHNVQYNFSERVYLNVICDMLNLRQIEAFRAVMIAGTVTGASRALNISQPAVSRLIRDLEKDVEIRLFDRKKGRVVPTLEANAFYQEVELSFIGLRNLEDFAREIRDSGLEKLAVGAMPALCLDLVPDVIRSYLSTRPGVKIGVVTLIRRSTGRTGSGRLCRQGYMLPRRNCRYAEQSVGPS